MSDAAPGPTEKITGEPDSPPLESIIADFEAQRDWLLTFITDPTGSRFFLAKSPELRLQQFQEQLERIGQFLAFAGHPELAFPAVHVAGTSGKGTVSSMIATILSACGLRTGLHVSPYLQVCTEKLIVNGQMIGLAEFSRLVRRFRRIHDSWMAGAGESLRYGEAWVALTFLWLAAQELDWGVIETGMGGRYDPTNALPSRLAVITNVDFDHIKSLGPGLDDIARHKAGIIKAGGLVVTAATNAIVLDVIRAEAERCRAELIVVSQQVDVDVHQSDARSSSLTIRTPWGVFDKVRVNLPGVFQQTNAVTAVTAVALLAHRYGLPLTTGSVRHALANFTFPGRMEIVRESPTTILDGAHNPHKMRALAATIRALYPRQRITAILGTIVSKEADGLVTALAPLIDHFIVTQPRVFGKPGLPPQQLGDVVRRLAPSCQVTECPDIASAVATGLAVTAPEDLLLITGSLYLVGEARAQWFPNRQLLEEIAIES